MRPTWGSAQRGGMLGRCWLLLLSGYCSYCIKRRVIGDFLVILYLHKLPSLGHPCSLDRVSPNNCQAAETGRSGEHALTWKYVVQDETEPNGSRLFNPLAQCGVYLSPRGERQARRAVAPGTDNRVCSSLLPQLCTCHVGFICP